MSAARASGAGHASGGIQGSARMHRRRLLPTARARATATCLAIAVTCLASASWIHIKAEAAQILISHAWSRQAHGDAQARPWPWADTTPVARLRIPGAAPLIVLEGASDRTLAFGPAHDSASVAPGEIGNSLISGHRDTHFGVLRTLKAGDEISTELPDGRRTRFVVTDLRVVDSRRVQVELTAAHPRLTLITCYPFDAINPHGPLRYIVTADKIS